MKIITRAATTIKVIFSKRPDFIENPYACDSNPEKRFGF